MLPAAESSVLPLVSADPAPVLTQPVSEQVADVAPTAVEVLQAVAGEPRLAELGLAGHTPVGLVQNMLEFIHMDLGLPWWGAIVVGKHALTLLLCQYQCVTLGHPNTGWVYIFLEFSLRSALFLISCVYSHPLLSFLQQPCWLAWLCFPS